MEPAKGLLGEVEYAEDAYSCARGADALVLVTEWDAFRALDPIRLRDAMNAPVLVDLRNVYVPDEMRRHGFSYTSVGRPTEPAEDRV